MKKMNKLNLLLISSSLLFSCSDKKIEWVKFVSADYFNTPMTLNYAMNEKQINDESFEDELYEKFVDKLSYYHSFFDRHQNHYDMNNNLITSVKTINEAYGTNEEIICSDELYSLLKLGVEMTKITHGNFNFFSGRLVDYWDDVISNVLDYDNIEDYDPYYCGNEEMINYALATPTVDEIDSLLSFNDSKKSVIFNKLDDVISDDGTILDRSSATSKYSPQITSGGIAKGYATDLIKDYFVSQNLKTGWLSSGSSSITMLSKPSFAKSKTQKIGFADPRFTFAREALFTIEFDFEFSLSTSGNYTAGKSYSFFDSNGNKIYRHHIVDSFNGGNPQFHRSVSLVSKTFSSGELDALSTAFFNLSVEDGLNLRDELLSDKNNYDLEIFYIDDFNDGLKIISTSDFNKKLTVTENTQGVIVEYVK